MCNWQDSLQNPFKKEVQKPLLKRIEIVDKLQAMDLPPYIEIKPDVMKGKPCLKGTRIPVYVILEKLGAGETAEEILSAYPQLSKDHINAALKYAAALANDEVILAS